MSPDVSCVWSAAMCPESASMPMPAGTCFSLPFTMTTSDVWMWVATPSAVSRGTLASFVLCTSSADAGVAAPLLGEDDPPLMPLMTAMATIVTSTTPATTQATGNRGLVAVAARPGLGRPGAGFDFEGEACFPPAARAFDAGGDFGLGLGLTGAPRRCGNGGTSLAVGTWWTRAALSGGVRSPAPPSR